MDEKVAQVYIGALLHDFGKVIRRSNLDRRAHPLAGFEMLKPIIKEKDVLNCVLYHHEGDLKSVNIDNNSIAYIVCLADNIAAGADRREAEDSRGGYQENTPLHSIYNLMNDCQDKLYYNPGTLNQENSIAFPNTTQVLYDNYRYNQIWQGLNDGIKSIAYDSRYINSLLSVLEGWMSYVPSSTDRSQVADISLYDHSKITAAVAGVLYLYLSEQDRMDFKREALTGKKKLMAEDAFLLFSCDLSGIQDFIYTTATKGALKTLRARSLYLEIFLEHIMDELLDILNLSRANLIYTGGGHAYALLPNTVNCQQVLEQFKANINAWLLDNFDTDLYLACAWQKTSGNVLSNKSADKDSYKNLFSVVSDKLSEEKNHRYTATDLRKMNAKVTDGYRECNNCRRSGRVNDDGLCDFCAAITLFSKTALKDEACFVITDKLIGTDGVMLPNYNGGNCYLKSVEPEILRQYLKNNLVRHFYTKNMLTTGEFDAGHIWMGDYHWQIDGEIASFAELADKATGIKRIGILRADVDNLGEAFATGFRRKQLNNNENQYFTLSRSATLSRSLSMFFKYHLNTILAKKDKDLEYFELRVLKDEEKNIEETNIGRKVHIIYAGGDDLFLVGAWDDVLSAGVDIYRYFQKYTQGTLSLSAGFGMFTAATPLLRLADSVGELEKAAKNLPGKNAVVLFESDNIAYSWREFVEDVLESKLRFLQANLQATNLKDTKENATFIYTLVQHLKSSEAINIAKIAYILGRRNPENSASKETKEQYRNFSDTIYAWSTDKNERAKLALAGQIYIYLNRSEGRENDGE